MTGFVLAAVLAVYLHVFLEWLFFVTKPSFLEALSAPERLRVLLIAPLAPAALLLGGGVILRLLGRMVPGGVLLALGRGILAGILSCCAFILLDNFTYTVFGVGVVSTVGVVRHAYLVLLLALFAWLYRRFPAAPGRDRSAVLAGGLVVASMIGALWQLAYSPSPPALGTQGTASPRQLPNIMIVSGDGVDAARTSAYRYERSTTPFLERLAQSALVFENAFPNVNSSAGSVASMVTGKHPLRTGLLLHPDILTGVDAYQHLPGILKGLGYRSIHMSTRLYTDPFEENMQHAFDVANFREHRGMLALPALPGRLALAYAPALYFLGEAYGRIAERVLHVAGVRAMSNPLTELETGGWVSDQARVEAVLAFLDRADGPVFAQLHLMGTHIPFVPRKPVFSLGIRPGERAKRTKDLYDDVVADFDRDVEGIVAHLESTGKLASTVLVVTSDHGWWWSYTRLPLIIRFPGGEPRGRRSANAQLVDLAPTLLDYLGMPVPEWMSGASLLDPTDPMRPIVSVVIRKWKSDGPFRRVGSVGLTICERVFWLNPHNGTFKQVELPGYVHPCGTSADAGTMARARLVDELRVNGYDVSSLEAAETRGSPRRYRAAPSAVDLAFEGHVSAPALAPGNGVFLTRFAGALDRASRSSIDHPIMPRGRQLTLVALSLGLFAMPTHALAYIDPASGSLILQVLLGGVAGILVITKLYYRKLMTLLGRRPRDGGARPADGEPPSR